MRQVFELLQFQQKFSVYSEMLQVQVLDKHFGTLYNYEK